MAAGFGQTVAVYVGKDEDVGKTIGFIMNPGELADIVLIGNADTERLAGIAKNQIVFWEQVPHGDGSGGFTWSEL